MVRFNEPVALEDGKEPTKTVWFNAQKGDRAEEAREEAWQWLQAVLRMYARQHAGSEGASLPDGFGPLKKHEEDGKYYHGDEESHEFRVIR